MALEHPLKHLTEAAFGYDRHTVIPRNSFVHILSSYPASHKKKSKVVCSCHFAKNAEMHDLFPALKVL